MAVLLKTWNVTFYRFRKFDPSHFESLEHIVSGRLTELRRLRTDRIEALPDDRREEMQNLFTEFEELLGPVGASKCLHLFGPRLFPLWDRKIAEAYGLRLGKAGTNGGRYWRMIEIARDQAGQLLDKGYEGNPLKGLDEYNYCRFTNKWM